MCYKQSSNLSFPFVAVVVVADLSGQVFVWIDYLLAIPWVPRDQLVCLTHGELLLGVGHFTSVSQLRWEKKKTVVGG